MNYIDTLHSVNTGKALQILGFQSSQHGAYLKYPCHKCGKEAVIKSYGEKKNLYYCPDCKASGHIIRLAMEIKVIDWNEAKELLDKKASGFSSKKLTKELSVIYEMEYDRSMESNGITETTAKSMGIGRPKGKTMLSGTIAFPVYSEGKKVAYWGQRIKDRKPVFHNSFNPELYLYNLDSIITEREVYVTTDMLECVRLIQDGTQAVCNFGLPYLSQEQ